MASTDSTTLTPNQRFWRLLKPDQKEIQNVYVYSIFNGLISLSLPLGYKRLSISFREVKSVLPGLCWYFLWFLDRDNRDSPNFSIAHYGESSTKNLHPGGL